MEQALAHPWLAALHDPNDEPVCPQVSEWLEELPIPRGGCRVQAAKHPPVAPAPWMQLFNSPEEAIAEPSLQQIRDGIIREMLAYNPEIRNVQIR